MSAFGGGYKCGAIDYGGKFVFNFEIAYSASKQLQWETARIRLVGSELPSRIPSKADLLKIAAFLDNPFGLGLRPHRNSANRQLEAYLSQFQTMPKVA